MDKIKEKKQDIKSNGEKKKFTKDEMIKQLEAKKIEIEKTYHQITGALAYIKEID